ncbi:MAG TPA: FtsX-like permease family protein [Acidimicrobiia bacterium]|nr:FtsX-like permease family protein [Acidimicrobiia bacterium]
MWKLTIASIRAKKARFFLTAIAVTLGVAFMAGTLVLTDTIRSAYDDIAGNVYEGTDAVVRSSRSLDDDTTNTEVRGSIDAAVLDQVRAVDGVAAADAQLLGIAMIVGDDGELLEASRNRAAPAALAWQDAPALNPMDLVSGNAPRAPDEIVIDVASAEKGGFAPGDTVRVISQSGSHEYVLAGTATYGGVEDGAAQVIAFTPETAATALGDPGKYSAIQVVAADGISESELVRRIDAALGTDELEVVTGTTATTDAREAAAKGLSFVGTFLMTFALVALLVGSFVIYNTFSITVAQRTRATALLRAIGAQRKQVLRSIVAESFVTGLVASALGLLLGIGAARGLALVLEGFGMDLPAHASVIKPSTIVASLLVGTVVTVFAAYLPARKASKVAPIAAMGGAVLDRSATSVRRTVAGVLLTLLGVVALASGLSAADAGMIGIGALGVFLGITVLGPVIARPIARVLGAPLPRLRGITGSLARENAMRNPRRTASTASALMIGVGLVVFITVMAASAKTSIATSIDDAMESDWIVETAWGMGGLSPDATTRIDELPETASVTGIRYGTATIADGTTQVSAFDPSQIEANVDLDLQAGAVAGLDADGIAVRDTTATDNGWTVGDEIVVAFPETGEQRFTVEAIYATGDPFGDYSISNAAFAANVANVVDTYVMVTNADGVSMTEARTAIDAVLDEYPNASLRTEEEFKGVMANQIDEMLNLVYVLLFLAIVIAFFGIANTLALSVIERTREVGLLRAVGMQRGQLRAAVRWESVLVAMLGASLGTLIGLGFGWSLQQAFRKDIAELTVPVSQLAMILLVAAVAAVLAALLPARRAARMDVLGAMQSE